MSIPLLHTADDLKTNLHMDNVSFCHFMAHENGDNQGEHSQSTLATTEFNFSTLKIH